MREAGEIDALPSKRLYLSIIADYDLNRSVCELVDNALDNWTRNGRKKPLNVLINFDYFQQNITITDDSGGIPKNDLRVVVSPGATSNKPSDNLIGLFGVGTKRAVVALAQDVRITTRFENLGSYRVQFDDAWLQDSDDWTLPYFEVDNIEPGTTIVELQKLRIGVNDQNVSRLRDYLSAIYAKFISSPRVIISIDSIPIKPLLFENWAYPPKYPPQEYIGELKVEKGNPVQVHIVGGLLNQWTPGGEEYGVYLYCNDRLITRALKTYDVGFATKLAGNPHPSDALARVIVSLRGEPQLMPWNSSKSALDPKNQTFISLREFIIKVVSDYTALSRRFQHDWQAEVFRHTKGKLSTHRVENLVALRKTYLPPLPKAKPRYPEQVSQLNKDVAQDKPWAEGLYEIVVAVDHISKSTLSQKNRIQLILLDSALEIGFKEYLVHESGGIYNDNSLAVLFSKRAQVQDEVEKYLRLGKDFWKRVDFYYWIRCDFVHKRAEVGISDEQIGKYRSMVHRLFAKMFGLNFPPL